MRQNKLIRRHLAPMGVKYGTEEGDKFHSHRCNASPLRENLKIGLWVTSITGALRCAQCCRFKKFEKVQDVIEFEQVFKSSRSTFNHNCYRKTLSTVNTVTILNCMQHIMHFNKVL